MVIKGYSASLIGSREMNQDSLLVMDDFQVYAVADGVGGGLRGEVASKMAVDGIEQRIRAGQTSLKTVFTEVQAEIYNEAMTSIGEPLMGTTCTALRCVAESVFVCHTGDSRAYLFSSDQLRGLTQDHETYEETLQGTVLSSYLGMPTESHTLRIQEEVVKVGPGDKLLLCSDGLYRQIEEFRMVELFRQLGGDPQKLVDTLADEASKYEYSDNVTVVVVTFE